MNLMLAELGKIYKDIEKVTPKSYFTRETEKAVRDVRKIFRFEDSGEIDARFYERMKLELVTRGAEY